MRISFLALLLLALIVSPHFAEAADLEILKAPPFVTPSPRWNGFYVGINGGGGLGPSSQTLTVDPLIAILGVSTTGHYKVSGALLVPRSDTTTKRDRGCSVSKATSIGPASEDRSPGP